MVNQANIEDQPRYVIDEGVQQKEIKILSEEQDRILNKLLKAAGSVLNEEERNLMVQLQQKLGKETDRVKSLRKMTVTDKPLDEYLTEYKKGKGGTNKQEHSDSEEGESDLGSPRKEEPKVTHIVGFKPEEVVRRYIECWNQQKFGAEYDCFSRDFLRHDRDAYISARHLSYQQNLGGGGMKILFGDLISSEVTGGDAVVVASKTVQIGNRKPQEETDKYSLKLERGRWLIHGVAPA